MLSQEACGLVPSFVPALQGDQRLDLERVRFVHEAARREVAPVRVDTR